MEVLALIADYLSDQEEGMKNLITCFLNQVMLIEALQQAGAAQYEPIHQAQLKFESRPSSSHL